MEDKKKNSFIEYDDDIYYSDEDLEEYKIQEEIYDDEIISDIRSEMIKYCDDMCLPLCDYLTHNELSNFIDYIIAND
jgi:hypothetical protein